MEIKTDDTYLALSWGQCLVIVGTEVVLLSVCIDLLKPPQHTEIPGSGVSKYIDNEQYLLSILGAGWPLFGL